MIYHRTLINIRKKHGLSQEDLANIIGCTAAHIDALEKNREKAAFEFVATLKSKLNLYGAPITEDERKVFIDKLHNWKILIDYGVMDKASEQKAELEKGAEASCSSSILNFYKLYAANYYRISNDTEAFNKTMSFLNQRTETFSPSHQFFYYRLLGIQERVAYRYNEALKAYKKAEKLDKESTWGDVGFYYIYGMCLSEMGYVAKAIEYLKRAKHLAMWHKVYEGKPNDRYDVYIDGYLADNLSKSGKADEAHAMLNKRLDSEKTRKNAKHTIGFIYLSIGTVYLRTKKYNDAIENFDTAFQHLDETSEAYKTNLYRKALALIESDRINEGVLCVDKALDMSLDDTRRTLFETLKHSAMLSNPESLQYMENTLISQLLKYGQYAEAVKCYETLSGFFKKSGDHKNALKYSELALEVHRELHKEHVEGGL